MKDSGSESYSFSFFHSYSYSYPISNCIPNPIPNPIPNSTTIPKKDGGPEFNSYARQLNLTLRKTVVPSLISAQVRSQIPTLNLKKSVVLSFIPTQDSVNPNPKKNSCPELDSYPR